MENTDLDAAYFAAIEAGDTDALNQLVYDAAHAAGYTIGPVIHKTNEEFTEFSKDVPAHLRKSDQQAFYFSHPIKHPFYKGKHTMRLFLKGDNIHNITRSLNKTVRKEGMRYNDAKNILLSRAREAGKDGVVFDGNSDNAPEYVIFEPQHIKSANTITRDAREIIIPLSHRFNINKTSINY